MRINNMKAKLVEKEVLHGKRNLNLLLERPFFVNQQKKRVLRLCLKDRIYEEISCNESDVDSLDDFEIGEEY